MHIERIKDV